MGNFNIAKRFIKTGILLLMFLSYLAYGQSAFGSIVTNDANPGANFEEANRAYQKGDFVKAAGLYQQLCDEGYLNGNLFYNLGNAYFKLGSKGRAILYYERAKRLIPGDADLNANLNYALAGVQEGVPDWKGEFLKFLTGMASVEQLAVSGSVWFFGLAILLIVWLLNPAPLRNMIDGKQKKWWLGIIICCAIMFLSSCALGLLTFWDQSRAQAVAVNADSVRFEPSSAATLYYNLAEGSRVQILEVRDNWAMIKRVDGKRGWVNKGCLERI